MDKATLFSNVPDYYKDSKVMENLFRAIANEFTRYEQDCENTRNELTFYSASKTLDRYESDFVLPNANNYPNDYRISKMRSKLRGKGTITEQIVKDIAESFSNGEVEVSTIPSEYTLVIKFVGTIGIPPNLEDLKEILSSLKSADWIIKYEYSYLLIKDINNVMTINQLQATQLNKFAGGA